MARGDARRWLEDHINGRWGESCVEWPFGRSDTGYGQIWLDGRVQYVHRVVCGHTSGKSPSAAQVAHSCGNRACVNPRHLRWASRSDNENDKVIHGRDNRGERNGQHRLTVSQVLEIRRLCETAELSQGECSAKFGVSRGAISDIVTRRTWAWLDASPDPCHNEGMDTYPPDFLDSDFMNGYVECLLWCSVDADPEDFLMADDPRMVELDQYPEAPNLRYRLVTEAWEFYSAWREFWRENGWADDYAGHDFALTRNHHGTGFWDRGRGEAGKGLSEAAKAYGETNLYLVGGADGCWEVTA